MLVYKKSHQNTINMIIVGFQTQNKLGKIGMFFRTFKNTNLQFEEEELV